MSFCTECGHRLEEGNERCTCCGEIIKETGKNNKLSEEILPPTESMNSTSSIERLKKTKRKLAIIIGVVILCLVFLAIGVVKYAHAAQVKDGIVLGNKYIEEGKYEEAILSFNKVIKIEPKNVEGRVGLARVYIKTGKPDEAEKVLKEAKGINPKKGEPYLELAKLYIDENAPDKAIKILAEGYQASRDESLNTMLEDLKSKIIINDFEKTITLGESYSLPQEITVKINDVEVQFPVKWDTTTVDTAKIGMSELTGILENTDKKVRVIINIIGIAAVSDINNTLNQNDKYSLPSKVTANMTDGSTREVEVIWNPSQADTSKAGSYTFEGTVSGYANKIKLTLNVVGIASIAEINKTINQNDKYSLPSKVTAKMTDGSTRDVEVKWNPSSVDTGKAGSYNYEGTVSGYSSKVKLTITIKAKQSDDDYTPEIAVRLAKQRDGIDLDNTDVGAEVSDPIYENGKKYYYVRLYSKSMRAQGGSGTIDFMTIAKDGSTI